MTDAHLSDEQLLQQLSEALRPAPKHPSESAMEALHDTLDAAVVDVERLRPRYFRRSVVAAAAAVAATVGVAAAAVASNTLPSFTRNVAYDVGLPVTAPALYQAQQSIKQLSAVANASPAGRTEALVLRRQLTRLQPSQLKQVRVDARKVLRPYGLAVPPNPAPSPPPRKLAPRLNNFGSATGVSATGGRMPRGQMLPVGADGSSSTTNATTGGNGTASQPVTAAPPPTQAVAPPNSPTPPSNPPRPNGVSGQSGAAGAPASPPPTTLPASGNPPPPSSTTSSLPQRSSPNGTVAPPPST